MGGRADFTGGRAYLSRGRRSLIAGREPAEAAGAPSLTGGPIPAARCSALTGWWLRLPTRRPALAGGRPALGAWLLGSPATLTARTAGALALRWGVGRMARWRGIGALTALGGWRLPPRCRPWRWGAVRWGAVRWSAVRWSAVRWGG